jgi:signal transduction histidine kinase
MTRSLTFKLIIAFLIVSLAGTILLALAAGRTTASEFNVFVFTQEQEQLVEQLAAFYRTRGSWDGVAAMVPALQTGMGPPPGMGPPAGMGAGRGNRGRNNVALADATGLIVVGGMGYSSGEQVEQATLSDGIPITVNGDAVGTLLSNRSFVATSPAETNFLARINRILLFGALGATAVALVLGVLLARTLTRPLRELTSATHAVARGQLGEQVTVRSRDELGELATAFNQMSRDLAYAQGRRRQMTADIAHDLRTPISIIQGHAEALRDGVLPPDEATFTLIHEEAVRLNRLVEDLRTLSRVEGGELSLMTRPVAVDAWLQHIAAAQQPRAQELGVDLDVVVADQTDPFMVADPDRMAQVLNNLVNNALRHTPAGGKVTLAATEDGDRVRLTVTDSGQGISAEDLPHIFDRFYRGDKARQRHEGGSGLGLAIARSIVEAHGGRIWAESQGGKGARFVVELPAASAAERVRPAVQEAAPTPH